MGHRRRQKHGEDPAWDAQEADELYRLLEQEIVPAFYDFDKDGIPAKWVARMRESMARLTPAFSANRAVREYTEHHYLPAGVALAERTAQQGRLAGELVRWRENIGRHWQDLRFGAFEVTRQGGDLVFRVHVEFGMLDPGSVQVELFADGQPPVAMAPESQNIYGARVPATRDAADFTPRAIPYFIRRRLCRSKRTRYSGGNDQRNQRCAWATKPLDIEYHDAEWGVPVHDDRLLFEFLILEGAQAGLTSSTILNKRDAYRKAFANFEPKKVANFGPEKVAALLENQGIVRNRLKIAASVQNAKLLLKVQDEFGGFDPFLWRFVDGKPIVNRWKTQSQLPAKTPLSDALSRNWPSAVSNSWDPPFATRSMQATGMVNDHLTTCFRYKELTHHT